jgi:hypothetical protein
MTWSRHPVYDANRFISHNSEVDENLHARQIASVSRAVSRQRFAGCIGHRVRRQGSGNDFTSVC